MSTSASAMIKYLLKKAPLTPTERDFVINLAAAAGRWKKKNYKLAPNYSFSGSQLNRLYALYDRWA